MRYRLSHLAWYNVGYKSATDFFTKITGSFQKLYFVLMFVRIIQVGRKISTHLICYSDL